MREELPELAVRVVNVVDLLVLDSVAGHPHRMDDDEFERLFTADRPVIFSFHGYPSAIHQLIYKRANPGRFHVRGYVEEGTTTTPFDMLVRNQTSRYHLVIEALRRAAGFSSRAAPISERYERKLRDHRRYIEQEGSIRQRSETGLVSTGRPNPRPQRRVEQPQAGGVRRHGRGAAGRAQIELGSLDAGVRLPRRVAAMLG